MSLRKLMAIVFCLTVVPAMPQRTVEDNPMRVNMFQLLASPEKFDGKTVAVVGFLTLGHEDDALYPHEADAVHLLPMNGLGVNVTEDMRNNRALLDHKYVQLIGTFRKADREQYIIGEFTKVKDCRVWSDPKMPLSKKLRELPGARPR